MSDACYQQSACRIGTSVAVGLFVAIVYTVAWYAERRAKRARRDYRGQP